MSDDVYVLRLSLARGVQGGYIWGVFQTLDAAKEAAATRLQLEDEPWQLEWDDWDDYRDVPIYSARIVGLSGSYALVERFQLGCAVTGKYDEELRAEREFQAGVALEEQHEREVDAEKLRKWYGLSDDDKERLKADYVTGDLSQAAIAKQMGLPYNQVEHLLRGLGPERLARQRAPTDSK